MAFDSDVLVKGAAAGATTEINSQRSRLKGFVIGVGATGSNGTVTFNDGGTAVFNVAVVGGTSDVPMNIPEQGVLFKSNLNVTTVNCTCTVFYTG